MFKLLHLALQPTISYILLLLDDVQVKQLMTLFEEKNTSRPVSPLPPLGRHLDFKAPKVEQPLMTSGSTHTADDSLPGLSDSSSLPVSKSFSSSIQNPLADANGGLSIKPTTANELTTTEANEGNMVSVSLMVRH